MNPANRPYASLVLNGSPTWGTHLVNMFVIPYAFITCAFFLTSTDFYMSNRNMLPLAPIYLAMALPALVIFYVLCKDIVRDRGKELIRLFTFCKEPIIFYYSFAVIGLLYCLHPGVSVELLNNGVYHALYAFLCLFFLAFARIRSLLPIVRFIFIAAFLIYFATVMIDVMQGSFTKNEGRAAGFAVNPNTGAFTLIMLLLLSLNWSRMKLFDVSLCCAAGLGVFVTYSRGGLILFVLSMTIYLARIIYCQKPWTKPTNALRFLVISLIVFLGLSIGQSVLNGVSAFNQDDSTRLQDVLSLVRGDNDAVMQDSRVDLVVEYWRLISESPILGYGTGFSDSRPAGPHNIYLQQWVDYGVIGVAVYTLGLLRMFRFFMQRQDYRGMTFLLITAIEGFFNDDMLLFRPFLIALVFLFVMAYAESQSGAGSGYSKKECA
ncbi:O-antigen ligase family protein [Paenibacillus flagellatus]|nr:O-antigen ligase family protein [Paenibacillus flagellatus]